MATGAQFANAKTWSDEQLTDTDLNAVIQNILNEGDAEGWGSAETSSANARETSDPGTYAAPNVPVTIRDMITHLRYIIARMIGGSNSSHLDVPAASLAALSSASTELGIGLEFEGNKGGASSTTDVLAKIINQGAIINAASLSSADVVAADFDSTNKKFGSYSYSLGSGNILAFPGQGCNLAKGSISAWFRNLAAGDYIAYNPLMGIELYLDSVSGRLTAKVTEKTASGSGTKSVHTVQGANTSSGNSDFQHALMQFRTNDENGASTDLIKLYLEGSEIGTAVSGADIDINPGDGGVWFFGAKRNDPGWDYFYSANDTPDNEGWATSGTVSGSAVGGVLNLTTSAANGGYTKSTPSTFVDLTQQTVEVKMKVNTTLGRGDQEEDRCCIKIQDADVDRGIYLNLTDDSVVVGSTVSGGVGIGTNDVEIKLNTKEYHIYTLTTTGAGSDIDWKLYIDGCFVAEGTNTTTDTTADEIFIGCLDTGSSTNILIEYLGIHHSAAVPPVAASSQGNLDSIGVFKSIVDSTIITSLQTASVGGVSTQIPSYGISLPFPATFNNSSTTVVGSATYAVVGNQVMYIPYDGVSDVEVLFTCTSFISTNGANGEIALAVDGDLIGKSDNYGQASMFNQQPTGISGINHSGTVTRNLNFGAVGLREVRPVVHSGSGVNFSIVGDSKNFTSKIAKDKRLG